MAIIMTGFKDDGQVIVPVPLEFIAQDQYKRFNLVPSVGPSDSLGDVLESSQGEFLYIIKTLIGSQGE